MLKVVSVVLQHSIMLVLDLPPRPPAASHSIPGGSSPPPHCGIPFPPATGALPHSSLPIVSLPPDRNPAETGVERKTPRKRFSRSRLSGSAHCARAACCPVSARRSVQNCLALA
jgi:hypothetical protein